MYSSCKEAKFSSDDEKIIRDRFPRQRVEELCDVYEAFIRRVNRKGVLVT